MKKISDNELINEIWLNQLRRLSKRVLHHYMGDRYGVVPDDKFWYYASSDEHFVKRERITDAIGKKQLRNRIIKLIENGKIYSVYGKQLLTFCIDSDLAWEAFIDARNFWISKGLPTGNDCVQVPNLEDLICECHSMLLKKYEHSYNEI